MNVAIVGNSNCVFRNGFAFGVESFVEQSGGVVRNYSLGGSCCALHIYTFHEKYSELCESNVIILDSLIIDSFHWKRGIINQDELVSLIDDMYALYSQLPAKVVSLLFPTDKYIGKHQYLPTYKAHRAAAKKYGVDVVDLYSLFPDGGDDFSRFFAQASHISLELASDIGYRVASICSGMEKKKMADAIISSPYAVVHDEVFGELERAFVSSSHYSANSYRLDREVGLQKVSGKNLVGVLHWNKSSVSKFVLSSGGGDDVIHFRTRYAFFEVLNTRRVIEEGASVRPGGRDETVTQKPAGKNQGAEYGVPHLVGLLTRGSGKMRVQEVGVNEDLSSLIGDVFV